MFSKITVKSPRRKDEMMTKNKKYNPTKEEKREMLVHVLYEILFTFGIPCHNPADYVQWEAVNYTRMGHARVLYSFFETTAQDSKNDDVLSEDYGFQASKIDRPKEDRIRLNKGLFHLSYSRLSTSGPWPDTILSCLQDRCIEFMEHIAARDDFFKGEDLKQTWKKLLDELKSNRELIIVGSVNAAGQPVYKRFLREPLPNGKIHLSSGNAITKSEPRGLDLTLPVSANSTGPLVIGPA